MLIHYQWKNPWQKQMNVSFRCQLKSVHRSEFGEHGSQINVNSLCGWWCTWLVLDCWLVGMPRTAAPFVLHEEETINHILIGCIFTQKFWFGLPQKMGLHLLFPQLASLIEWSVFHITLCRWWPGSAGSQFHHHSRGTCLCNLHYCCVFDGALDLSCHTSMWR